jgi:hypothetical protein
MKAAVISVLRSLLLVTGLVGTSAATANTVFGPLTVTAAGTYGNGAIFIMLSGNINAPGCSIPNRIDVPASNPQVKTILAIALEALQSGQPVYGAVNGCDPNGGDATIDTSYASYLYIAP